MVSKFGFPAEVDKMSGFWDSERVLGDLQKGSERIRIREVRRRNIKLVDIRLFWQDKDDEWQPSKRGISVPLELVGSLAETLTRIARDAASP
jgi:hypothetical protein